MSSTSSNTSAVSRDLGDAESTSSDHESAYFSSDGSQSDSDDESYSDADARKDWLLLFDSFTDCNHMPWTDARCLSWSPWIFDTGFISVDNHHSAQISASHLSLCIQVAEIIDNVMFAMSISWTNHTESMLDEWFKYMKAAILHKYSEKTLLFQNLYMNLFFCRMEWDVSEYYDIEHSSREILWSPARYLGTHNGWDEYQNLIYGGPVRIRSFTTHGNNLLNLVLPQYNQWKQNIETLSRFRPDIFRPIDTAKIDAQIRSASGDVLDTLIVGLDVAESAAKLIPGVGNIVEGSCGIVRKIIVAAKRAATFKDSCSRIAADIAQMTLQVIDGMALSQEYAQVDLALAQLYSALLSSGSTIERIAAIKRRRLFIRASKYESELEDVKARVHDAFCMFKIHSHVEITSLVRQLGYKMEELKAAQHDILHETRKISAGQTRIEDRTRDMHHILLQFTSATPYTRRGYGPGSDRISIVDEVLDPVA